MQIYMTTREVVEELRTYGHKIKYRVRKDGGILITSIDGVKYRGAAGNTMARAMIGDRASLSKKRMTQLKIIKPTKGPKPKKDVLTEKVKEKIKQVQKAYRKNKVPIEQGRVTRRLIRKIIGQEGYEAAMKKLEQAERYATGYAISGVIQALAQYIQQLANLTGSQLLQQLADDVLANDGIIKDEWIKPAYDILYGINHGRDIRDVVEEVRKVLHI